uniref:ATP synthase F0 subunit 8 n=1 Tax=Narceus annularis TaxID=174156 RepID=Q8WAA2_NARAN|nr:ATP synthase F0 subunit 8 [Narceus annularus]AAL18205.1 ATP synthase F0 subunit 8 [Narceus annularus]
MPQMFPTQWITLTLFFTSMVLILFVKINYFFSQPTPPASPTSPITLAAWLW